MHKDTRNAIERATQRARKLLEEDFAAQLEGDFDVHRDGVVAAKAGGHLSARRAFQRERIVAAIEHKRAAGMSAADAARDYLRDAAFTTLNRFVALKMLEARDLLQQCITSGEQSAGYREFCGMAPGLPLLPDSAGYRLYIESLFDELSTEVKVLFDRRDPSSVLWPKRATFEQLLEILNATELSGVWGEDETIGWVYQFFNGQDERKKMREESQAPRNSRELAVRNQFFTPRYVVQFLTDNTLGRIWYEMRGTKTALAENCEYMVRNPGEAFAPRAKKDPRDLRVLDPACGSGHFLLYAFDLLLAIYEEAYADPESPKSEATGKTLTEDYPSAETLRKGVPGLVLAHNLHGVDIDPRCAQIAQLALWMRAQRAFSAAGVPRGERPIIQRTNIIVAEPIPADEATVREFADTLEEDALRNLFLKLVETMKEAGDLGLLLKLEAIVPVAGSMTQLQLAQGFWSDAERALTQAVEVFLRTAGQQALWRRKLFANDTLSCLGLLGLSRTKYDILLMNPPFGAPTDRTKAVISQNYNESRFDLSAVFMDRAMGVLTPGGGLGAIANRTIFFLSRCAEFRRMLLQHRLPVGVDIGLGALDAFVETVILTAFRESPSETAESMWLSVSATDAERGGLKDAVRVDNAGQSSESSYRVPQAAIKALPNAAFGYWLHPEFVEAVARSPTLGRTDYEAKQGLATKDNERFVRLRWEVDAASVGVRWRTYAKGGAYAPMFAEFPLVVDWGPSAQVAYGERDGQFCCLLSGRRDFYLFRPCVTYSERTARFSARVLPAGSVFDLKGSAVFSPQTGPGDRDAADLLALCATLNSPLAQYFFDAFAGASDSGKARDYTSGLVESLPVGRAIALTPAVLRTVENAYRRIAVLARWNPSSVWFHGIPSGVLATGALETICKDAREADAVLAAALREAGVELGQALQLGRHVMEEAEKYVEDQHRAAAHELVAQTTTDALRSMLRNALLGYAFGAFDSRVAAGSIGRDPVANTLEELPSIPEHALGWELKGAALQECLKASPFPVPEDGILVDDPGSPRDLLAQMESAAHSVCLNDEDRRALLGMLGEDEEARRAWIQTELFDEHLRAFAGFRRRAPLFWQLATPSALYSVWVFLHRLTKDTFYKMQHEHVGPKLRLETSRLESLRRDIEAAPTPSGRKELLRSEALVDELRVLLDEIKRIAPLWNPSLDDGVIINFAPLWRLVPQNKSWQKELKSTWDALCDGKYDWAHLAMHLWPERVVPKCAKDRSVAIAHELEDVFWVEGTDGKWTARKTPARRVDELVRERTSPAVKSALNSLLEAPVQSGAAKKTRKGKANA